jgi:RNA-binding protein YlmH
MNYSALSGIVVKWVDDLVSVGLSRKEAEDIVLAAECRAVQVMAASVSDDQFMLDFRKFGATKLAQQQGKTRQAIRKRWNKLLAARTPVVAEVVR